MSVPFSNEGDCNGIMYKGLFCFIPQFLKWGTNMIKLFLVEDEIVIRRGLHRMIPWAEYGFEFTGEAKDGEMALPMIRKIQPDVLVTDIKMPFMDGLTLSRLVKKELPDTKIIIISGHDDFEYARQAISLGVEQYLLKPVTKSAFIEALEEVRGKYEQENAKKDYFEKFQNEIKEYEKNSRRDFFELLVSGATELSRVYEEADRLDIDISASCYNLVLYDISSRQKEASEDGFSQSAADVQERIDMEFGDSANYQLFRNQLFSYAILIRGEEQQMNALTRECLEKLEGLLGGLQAGIDWHMCAGSPVERLSLLPECYRLAMKTFSLRYVDSSHLLTSERPVPKDGEAEEIVNLSQIDMDVVSSDIIRNFLYNAMVGEVEDFVKNYISMIGESAVNSLLFRQYILLNIHFCTVDFAQKLGMSREEIELELKDLASQGANSREEFIHSVSSILKTGIGVRNRNSKNQHRGVISKAIAFMEENYAREDMTLNNVAQVAHMSANHFSAIFSQEVGQTFIEYLTDIRMKKAKELLRSTAKRSGEIALEVGYRDSHYFSYLFKKTQGYTPSEYRNSGEKRDGEP